MEQRINDIMYMYCKIFWNKNRGADLSKQLGSIRLDSCHFGGAATKLNELDRLMDKLTPGLRTPEARYAYFGDVMNRTMEYFSDNDKAGDLLNILQKEEDRILTERLSNDDLPREEASDKYLILQIAVHNLAKLDIHKLKFKSGTKTAALATGVGSALTSGVRTGFSGSEHKSGGGNGTGSKGPFPSRDIRNSMFVPSARVRSATAVDLSISEEGMQDYADAVCYVASMISCEQFDQLQQDGDNVLFDHIDEGVMRELVYNVSSMVSFTPYNYTEPDILAEKTCRLCGSEHHNLPNCFLRDRKEKCQFSHWYLARLDQQLIEKLLLNATRAGIFKRTSQIVRTNFVKR
jgi:hypothetical protein